MHRLALLGTGARSGSPAVGTFETFLIGVSGDPVTFADADIGTADPYRVVVLGITWGAVATITSITIGGITATLAVAGSSNVAIYYAAVPTGTTADIVIDFNTTSGAVGLGIYSLLLYGSIAPTDTEADAGSAAAVDIVLNVIAGGYAVVVTIGDLDASTHAWANATERYDSDTGAERSTGASHPCTVTEARTITDTETGGPGSKVICGAHWR